MGEKIAHFCINCGTSIPDKAKFCPNCGEKVELSSSVFEQPDQLSVTATSDLARAQEAVNKNFTLLDPGDEFRGYKILRMLNKDVEGIKYIAEKNNKEYVLKVFFKSSFQNMETLFGLQMRLSRLGKIKDSSIAQVEEVNQSHSPAYMAVEYVHGVSLAEIRKYNPERITEENVRILALKLIRSAESVRKHGLTISNLTLNGVLLNDDQEPIILSSGIFYEEVDEREEVFAIGAIIAQLLAQNTLYQNLYETGRLRTNKFIPISNATLDINNILAECLHRNISQRFASLEKLAEAIKNLPPVQGAELTKTLDPRLLEESKPTQENIPRHRIEYGFWALVVAVIIIIILLFTTNMYTVLFGTKGDKLQYTGFNFGSEDADDDTLRAPAVNLPPRESRLPSQTVYGELKNISGVDKYDPRRQLGTSEEESPTVKPLVSPSRPGPNYVYLEPGTYGFGRLSNNQAHNVSLSGFYISKYEVTQAQWNRFMKPANVSAVGDKLPVDNISWFDIAIFCNGLSEAENLNPAYRIRGIGASRVVTCDFDANGYRLPTEAEWEYAAKAGNLFIYSGSDNPDDIAWYRDNSAGKLRQPGLKNPNDFGLYDCTGNVSEWVWDWFDANYIRALPTFVNPHGPNTGTQKTIRGGNVMNSEGRNLNILWRDKGDPNRGYQFVGFRLVRTK